ncbi:MAG TPA: methyltransferase domain-containing protein [Holophagaceae bacterium]|nr:methyltransferase domain-containing protein [Holophagaceae bacterium]
MTQERDYVLGTHDEEIERLGLQHRVWRPRALDAWRRAGFTVGQTLVDLGCGPGYAALDLAEIVGPGGRVHALDRSRRFLNALDAFRAPRGLGQITPHEVDLDEAPLPVEGADGAWARWVFAFVKQPRELLRKVHGSLRPGGVLVLHEYFDYRTWRMIPRCADQEAVVGTVMASWRREGGEPDIALDLSRWLEELGFELRALNPLIDVVSPRDHTWHWPIAFLRVGMKRLVDLGRLEAAQAQAVEATIEAMERDPRARMITPGVLEVIAVKR